MSHDAFHESYEHTCVKDYVLTPVEAKIVNTATTLVLNKHPERADRVRHLDLSPCSDAQYVAQQIAKRLEKPRSLRGTFFLRFPEYASLDVKQHVITTLAHQLELSPPDAEPAILEVMRSDPYILTRDMKLEVSDKAPPSRAPYSNRPTRNGPHLYCSSISGHDHPLLHYSCH